MDVYFCDECGTRVTSLDLRAGKGMRRRHDVICPGCVDLGKAADWLARAGAQTATEPVPALKAPAPPQAHVPPAKPDPVAIARDRARTQRDLPPQPTPPPAPRQSETDAIPAKPAAGKPAPPPAPAPVQEQAGFAAAAGAFGALDGRALPPPPPGLVDDEPEDAAEDPLPPATPRTPAPVAESPFEFAEGEAVNPQKAETRAIPESEAKGTPKTPRPASDRQPAQAKTPRPASGRHETQGGGKASGKGGTTTSKRASQKTTARKPAAEGPNKKLVIGSLVSLAVIGAIFGLLIFREMTKEKKAGGGTEKVDVLTEFKDALDGTRKSVEDALRTDNDLGKLERAKSDLQKLNESYFVFEKKAKALGWSEDNLEQQLENWRYSDTRALLRRVNDKIMVLKNQQGH